MTLADVLAVVAGLAIAGAGFASLSVILAVLFPEAVSRARSRAEARPGRSIAIGAAAVFAAVLAVGAFLGAPFPPLRAGAVLTLLGVLTLAVLGGAGLSDALGRRSRSALRGESGSIGLRDMLRGVLLLESAALLPIVGWFVVLPAALLLSLGAGIGTILFRSPALTVPTAKSAVPPPAAAQNARA
jgi:hypothetical protein